MDDFSRAILRELLPAEKEPPRAKRSKRDPDERVLDHLASPILLERAGYLRKLAKLGEGWASEVLKEYPGHAIHLLVRSRDGGAEQHERFADLFIVLDGRAALVTGGAIADAKGIAPGEVRGSHVEGGRHQELRAGDLAHVPAGLPHQMLVSGDRFVTCLVLKIAQDPLKE
ncbi:MAG TPA: cupin domain-containing protein [Terracidiphilus sp.]|nr:cupin domain-containing protein [Terracidiphilus sp.]